MVCERNTAATTGMQPLSASVSTCPHNSLRPPAQRMDALKEVRCDMQQGIGGREAANEERNSDVEDIELILSLQQVKDKRECVLFMGTQFNNLYTAVSALMNGKPSETKMRPTQQYAGVGSCDLSTIQHQLNAVMLPQKCCVLSQSSKFD